ncbi:MAG: hypothetical protein BM556_13825 [Bacteriovorax sp. MedPE-SWde]|nr:MAG: hypothetical protein BM556_13825 [Bacteriovorax sp. MedPE-SWde]
MKLTGLITCFLLILIAPFLGHDGFLGLDLGQEELFVFNNLRLPRVLLAFLVGGTLSVIGWMFQIVFKNSLATPYTMGISSIAALAMAVSELLLENSMVANKDIVFIIFYLPILILLVIGFKKNIGRDRLLLFGVCLGIFSSSAIVFIQSVLGNESVTKLVRWMMGGLEIVGFSDFKVLLPIIVIGLLTILSLKKELTMISIGEEFAASRGVDLKRSFITLIIVSNILVASIVWFCGPIGFVGLIIPHLTKKVFGQDFSKNASICFFIGATFLVVCDLLSRTISADQIIPVGAITACLGAPVLVYHLLRK